MFVKIDNERINSLLGNMLLSRDRYGYILKTCTTTETVDAAYLEYEKDYNVFTQALNKVIK